jgi:hypothetical protein
MVRGNIFYTILLAMVVVLNACSVSKHTLLNYYTQNQHALDSIEATYKQLYAQKPFSVGFSDKAFNFVSVTIITDSLQYIYEFDEEEELRMMDTLAHYSFNAIAVTKLIRQMRAVHCTWINRLDYYVNNKQQFMVFLSARPVAVTAPFSYKKYYILAYFPEPQYFDEAGRLYASRRKRKLRKINNEVYSKINDKVCYTISENFR